MENCVRRGMPVNKILVSDTIQFSLDINLKGFSKVYFVFQNSGIKAISLSNSRHLFSAFLLVYKDERPHLDPFGTPLPPENPHNCLLTFLKVNTSKTIYQELTLVLKFFRYLKLILFIVPLSAI